LANPNSAGEITWHLSKNHIILVFIITLKILLKGDKTDTGL